jgi:Cu/Ag efflux protein CusF
MKSFKQLFSAALLASAAIAGPVLAQAAAADMTDAEVRKVDTESRKITLKHGAIKNLDMPPMTMVFEVKDAAMLAKVKAGDKVRFKATQDAGGKITVTELQPAK